MPTPATLYLTFATNILGRNAGKSMMNCILAKRIDSYQKLYILLFLYQHPDVREGSQALAKRLYLGDVNLFENVMAELRQVDLVDFSENQWTLQDRPEIRAYLQCLTEVFEDPLMRQTLLDEVKRSAKFNACHNNFSPVAVDCSECVLFHNQRVEEEALYF